MRMLMLIAWLLASGYTWAAAKSLDEARALLEQWVQTRQLVAKTRADWLVEKDLLEGSMRLFERELADLDARVKGLGEANAQVTRERHELEAEKEKLEEAGARARALATAYEERLRVLNKRLPEPLQRRIEPLLKRFPAEAESTRMPATERLQNVVGVLNEIDKFNSSISVESEIRRNAEGREVQVETLYLGLAQAYFVGEEGQFAGMTIPTSEGWETMARNELGPTITRAIGMYRDRVPPALVTLPFEVK